MLAELLETAPPEVRREITAWLLCAPRRPATVGVPWLPPAVSVSPGEPVSEVTEVTEVTERVRRFAGGLPAGTDSQVVTLRLPTERHAALRDWCAAHGFSMAAVVRGLVERFLEQQAD
jgi:hypothetical protein